MSKDKRAREKARAHKRKSDKEHTHTQCPLMRVGQSMKKERSPIGESQGTPAAGGPSQVDALPTKGTMIVGAGEKH